jgi:bacillolysin
MIDAKRLLITGVMVALPVFAVAAEEPADAAASAALRRMEEATGGAFQVTRGPGNGPVRFLSVREGAGIAVAGATGEERARTFLGRYGDAFGLAPSQELLLVRPSAVDELGMEHVRLQQAHRGVPVTGAELIVHLRGGRVISASGKALAKVDRIDTMPGIAAERAVETARAIVVKYHGPGDVTLSTPRLEIFDEALIGGQKRPASLAWFVEASRLDARRFVWVDARQGRLLLQFSQLPDARNRSVYTANSTAKLPGKLKRREGGPATGDADIDRAYDYSGDTYDYYFEEHGRDSYDGRGAPIKSTVDYCPSPSNCPFANAFWNGKQMVYGDGFSAADDVDAHELTHAVTEHSAGLLYWMQSGALNESFSDIFGETVDLMNGAGTDTAETRWKMGEDVPIFGALRDMEEPNLFNDPGKMSDLPYFKCNDNPYDPIFDNGGVHSNSGVPNHAYQLMVDGGNYNSITVAGIGLTKAGKIQYRALTAYLTQASDFLDNYSALLQSCNDLIGTAGISGADCGEVEKALQAVEMNQSLPCLPTQADAPPACPAGKGPQFVFADDLEKTNTKNWKTTVQDVGNHWTLLGGIGVPPIYYDFLPASGKLHFWGYDFFQAGSSSVEMAKTVTVPAGGFMQFRHMYSFESEGTDYFDGGILEYSTDNGVNWIDAGSLISAGQHYGGTLVSGGTNPLRGFEAFVRDSWGYTTTQLDLGLAGLAGQGVRFRFRIGTDDLVDDYGWFVDDVQMYSCVPGGTVGFSAPAFGGSEATGKAVITVTRTGGTAPFTVDYYTQPFSAEAGEDYVAVSGRLNFGLGVMTQSFEVPIINDTEDDDLDEGFQVLLRNVSPSATLNPAADSADVSIADNDVAGVIQLGAASFKAAEMVNPGTAMVTLKRTGGAASGATVHFTTSDGTAHAPGDYTHSEGFVVFGAGQVTAKIFIPIAVDTIVEGTETFTVTLDSSGGGATLGALQSATISITDNDAGGILQFKLAVYNVSEGGVQAVIAVTRTGGLASGVTVHYATSSGTAFSAVDYFDASGTLTFGAGVMTQSFTVDIIDDPVPGEPNETVMLDLTNPQGGATLGPRSHAVLTIRDN